VSSLPSAAAVADLVALDEAHSCHTMFENGFFSWKN
jgi:hypothetical protein